METRWKDIKGYEGIAQVDSNGYIRVLERTFVQKNGRKRKYTERVSKGTKDSEGYMTVRLTDADGKGKNVKVHRIVAETFLERPEGKTHVQHLNSLRGDNRAENLEWVTRGEKQEITYKEGRRVKRKGTDITHSKLTDEIALQIYLKANNGVTYIEISQWLEQEHSLSLSKSNVSNIKHKRTWKHIHNEISPVWAD